MGSKGPSKDVIRSALGNTETKHTWIEIVLYYDHLTQHRIVNVIQVVFFLIKLLTATGNWSLRTYWSVWTRVRVITRIATRASTNLAPFHRQSGLANFLRYLTQARFPSLWKGLHTLSAAAISRIKLFFIIVRMPVNLLHHSWSVLRILASTDKIFNRTSIAATRLTTFLSNFCSSLFHGDNTDTWLSIALCMFALSTTVLESFAEIVLGVLILTVGMRVWALTIHFWWARLMFIL